MTRSNSKIYELNERSKTIFSKVIDNYCQNGEPVGSKTIANMMDTSLSPATIRNVMSDLEDMGLLYSPHTSAGRVPTEAGLQIFVNGVLEIGSVGETEKQEIQSNLTQSSETLPNLLEKASSILSGLSQCAGLVSAPKLDRALKHIEFVKLDPQRIMVILVTIDGIVENRILDLDFPVPRSSLIEAMNFLNAQLSGITIKEVRKKVLREIKREKSHLDDLASQVIEKGLASWGNKDDEDSYLIIKGQSKLLEDIKAIEELDNIKDLLEKLEAKKTLAKLLEETSHADGVQIFIGAQNNLFRHSGCSMIIAPYSNKENQLVGAIGVIGPARLNYAKIVPMVDFTAKVMSRYIG